MLAYGKLSSSMRNWKLDNNVLFSLQFTPVGLFECLMMPARWIVSWHIQYYSSNLFLRSHKEMQLNAYLHAIGRIKCWLMYLFTDMFKCLWVICTILTFLLCSNINEMSGHRTMYFKLKRHPFLNLTKPLFCLKPSKITQRSVQYSVQNTMIIAT